MGARLRNCQCVRGRGRSFLGTLPLFGSLLARENQFQEELCCLCCRFIWFSSKPGDFRQGSIVSLCTKKGRYHATDHKKISRLQRISCLTRVRSQTIPFMPAARYVLGAIPCNLAAIRPGPGEIENCLPAFGHFIQSSRVAEEASPSRLRLHLPSLSGHGNA